MSQLKTFDIGETVVCKATFKVDGELTNPTTIKIYIYDPAGVVDVDGTAMNRSSLGTYYYDYDSADKDDGIYPVYVEVVNAGRTVMKPGAFRLH